MARDQHFHAAFPGPRMAPATQAECSLLEIWIEEMNLEISGTCSMEGVLMLPPLYGDCAQEKHRVMWVAEVERKRLYKRRAILNGFLVLTAEIKPSYWRSERRGQ